VRYLRSRYLVLCCGAILVWPSAGFAGPLEQTFALMDKAAQGFRGFKAKISHLSHLDAINEDTVDSGTIVVRRAKPQELNMLVEFKQPDPKEVSLTGKQLLIYYPKLNTVDQYDLTKEYKVAAQQFLLLGFGTNSAELKNNYTVTLGGPETVAGQKTTRIVLIPKDKEVAKHSPKFELWISDETGIAVQQKVYGTGGDYDVFTYTDMKLMNVPEGDVKLNIPKDAVLNRNK
jgi:outer membrane lipoprotein-sorting protein